MKKQLIFMSLLAMTGILKAQWTATSCPVYTFCKVGINTASPANNLHIVNNLTSGSGGITIQKSATAAGAAGVELVNSTTGGRNWGIFSLGLNDGAGAGNFSIYDLTSGTGGNRFFISGSNGNVGIGNTNPSAPLHVVGGTRCDGIGNGGNASGVTGNGIGSSNSGNVYGVVGQAYDGALNFGGWFRGRDGGSGVTSYGVYADVINPFALSGGVTYGIYATDGGNHTGGLGPTYAGYFNGDVVTAGGSYFYSDSRLKKNILKINNSLDIIKKLNPVNYDFDKDANPNISLPSEKQFGFISQEISQILPDLTKTLIHPAKLDENGNEIAPSKEILGLNYQGFIALLTKGMQEQQQQIEELKTLVNSLVANTSVENKMSSYKNTMVELSDKNALVLNQNVPNPFAESTVISYNIPTDFSKAQIIFITNDGKVIRTIDITEKGAGNLNVFANDLTNGLYAYTLVVDGKTIDTKKMIKQ